MATERAVGARKADTAQEGAAIARILSADVEAAAVPTNGGTSSVAAGDRVPEVEPAAEPWVGRRHVLDLDDFSRDEIEVVFQTADEMKEVLSRPIPRLPPLRGRSVVNLFYEPSTRTRVSFEVSAKNLGADVINVTASGSSVEKGETLVDTVQTLRALGAD